MYEYILYLTFLLFLVVIYKNRIKIKQLFNIYQQFKKFVDPDNKHGHFFVIKNIVSSVYTIVSSKFVGNKNFVKFNKNLLKVPYSYNDKEYFYLLKVPKGVTPIKSIKNENGQNIEEYITPYLGPNLDCHGAKLYPKDFGYKEIIFTDVLDIEKSFKEDQQIVL